MSYTRDDMAQARSIHKALERYRLPGDLVGGKTTMPGECLPPRFSPIFFDVLDAEASAELSEKLKKAIRDSHWLIVVCSTAATRAPWVDKEIRSFRERNGNDKVLAVIVDADSRERDVKRFFPPALIDIEPLAADVRRGHGGKKNAVISLLAGMAGLPFDALKRRDLHRQNVRFRVCLIAALSLAAIIASLAYYANDQRLVAEHAQLQTVAHLEFMLSDLKCNLEPLGKLGILEQVVSKTKLFAEQAASSEALCYLRSVACLNQGDLALTAGDSSLALDAFQQSLAVRAQMLKESPLSSEKRIAYAEALSFLGKAQAMTGNYVSALTNQLESLNVFRSCAETNSVDFLKKYACANELASLTLHEEGRDVEALSLQNSAVACMRLAAQRRPLEDPLKRQLATAIDKRGDIGVQMAPQESLRDYTEAVRLRLKLSDANAADLPLQEDVSRSWESFASWNLKTGDTRAAFAYYNKALEIRRHLVKQEPLNATWQHLYAQTLTHLADLHLSTNNLAEASSQYETSHGIYQSLSARDPQHSLWQECLIQTIEKRGDILRAQASGALSSLSRQQLAQAIACYQTGRAARERLWRSEPQNLKWLSGLSISDIRFGDYYFSRGDFNKALRSYEDAVEKRERLVACNDSNLYHRFMLGVAYGKVSQIHIERQDVARADVFAKKKLDILERLLQVNLRHSQWANECAVVHYKMGARLKLDTSAGAQADAQKHFNRARDLFMELKRQGFVNSSTDTYLKKLQM